MGLAAGSCLFLFGCAANLTVVDCPPEWEEKLQTVYRYMNAAARSEAFQLCIDAGVNRTAYLYTFQEHLWTGPYSPCDSSDPDLDEDPRFVSNPSLGVGAIYLIATNYNDLEVTCTTSSSWTAFTGDDYGYLHGETERVSLGYRAWNEEPNHQIGWADFGPDFDFTAIYPPGYPVDELAGIILHEKTHTHGFSHGTSANECGYAAYDCPASGSVGHCRANSLPEIAEACMSEVVENSVGWCLDAECPEGETPILNQLPPGMPSSPNCVCL